MYLNCRETYEDMIDNHSYAHNLPVSSCYIKNWSSGFESAAVLTILYLWLFLPIIWQIQMIEIVIPIKIFSVLQKTQTVYKIKFNIYNCNTIM